MAKKENSLAYTGWMCKYHIVFTPKQRRKVIYYQYREDIRDIIKQLCSYKGVQIIEGHVMPDHVHILVSILPKMIVSSFMGYLKGKSAQAGFPQLKEKASALRRWHSNGGLIALVQTTLLKGGGDLQIDFI